MTSTTRLPGGRSLLVWYRCAMGSWGALVLGACGLIACSEPMEPMEPTDPMEPAEPTDPTDPMEPMEPLEPTVRPAPMLPMLPMPPFTPVRPDPYGCDIESPTGVFAATPIRSRTPMRNGNSVAALREADAEGYRHVEVDVVLSADLELIPGRYDDIGAFTTCRGLASEETAAALAACEYLDDPGSLVLPIWHGLEDTSFHAVYLDLKFTLLDDMVDPSTVIEAMVSLSARLGRPGVLVAMSYDRDVTEALATAGFRTGYKGYPEPSDALAFIEEAALLGAEMVCIKASSLSVDTVARSHALGVWQLPWESAVLTDVSFVIGLIDAGVGGLITDLPDFVQAIADERCSAP